MKAVLQRRPRVCIGSALLLAALDHRMLRCLFCLLSAAFVLFVPTAAVMSNDYVNAEAIPDRGSGAVVSFQVPVCL